MPVWNMPACVAGGFGGRALVGGGGGGGGESRDKTSGAAAGELGRETR